MRSDVLYIITLLLLFAFTSKLMLNAYGDAEPKKASIALSETDESQDEKTEKDASKEKTELMHYLHLNNWQAHHHHKNEYFYTNTYIPFPIHFLAVPTPPPWA